VMVLNPSEDQPPAATAMGLVRMAYDGEIDHDTLIYWLTRWHDEPQYQVTHPADDWQVRENSADAIFLAYDAKLIDKAEELNLRKIAHQQVDDDPGATP